MLYRAHKDIHLQLPADAMSVSLNIVETSHSSAFRDQYRFDLENAKIDGIMTRMSLEPMLALAAHYGGGEGEDLLASFAAAHPSDRIRWCALRARAAAAPTLDARIADLRGGRAHRQPAGQRHGAARGRQARGRPRLDRRRAARGGAPDRRLSGRHQDDGGARRFCYKSPRWAVSGRTANGYAQYPDRRALPRPAPFRPWPASSSIGSSAARLCYEAADSPIGRPARDIERCDEALARGRHRRSTMSSRPTSIAAYCGCGAAWSTRRSPISTRRWRSIPTSPKPISTRAPR